MQVQELLKAAWENLKRSFGQLLVLNLVFFGIAFLIAVVLILVIGVGVISQLGAIQSNPAALLKLVGPFVILIAIFVVIFIILGLIVQAGTILILGTDKKYALGDLFRTGLKLAFPLFILSITSALLVVPAFFLLFIPGLFVAFFFAFSSYELVLNGRGVTDSLKRSVYLVKNNFGYVLSRVLVIFGLSILIWLITAWLGRGQGGGLISWIVTMIFGWYAQSYAIVLYKNLELKTKDKKSVSSLLPFILIAILGYIAAGAITYSVFKLVTNPTFQKGFQQGYGQTLQKENPDINNLYNLQNLENLQ